MKKIISFILIVLLLVSTVFAAANLNRATTEKITSLIDETEINIKETNTIEENSKKQEIIDAKPDTKDFQIFEDPVIFQEFVQFNDYATMFQTYIEYLYADLIEAEDAEFDELEVNDFAYIDELEVEELYVGEEAYFEEGIEVEEQIEAEEIYADEIEVEELHVFDGLTVGDQARFADLSQTYGNEYAYVCVDADGMIFRSDIACDEINSNPGVTLLFEEIGETQTIDFEGQEFEIKLVDALYDSAVFRINGDFDIVEEGEGASFGGLDFELEVIGYSNGIFNSLKISLESLAAIGPIMVVQSFPVDYEFSRVYENFMFDPPGQLPFQDMEIIASSPTTEKILLEVNDEDIESVAQGDNVSIGGIDLFINQIDFDDGVLENVDITVYGVDPGNSPVPLYPEHFITDGEFNGLFVIGATAPANDVVTLIDIVADMNSYASVPASSTVLDTEVNSISEQNIITVGTACDNSIIYDLYGNPFDCNYYEQEGIGILKAFETGDDIYALTVDGYGFAERLAAKNVLLNWGDYEDVYDLREQTICVQISTNNARTSSTRDYIVFEC